MHYIGITILIHWVLLNRSFSLRLPRFLCYKDSVCVQNLLEHRSVNKIAALYSYLVFGSHLILYSQKAWTHRSYIFPVGEASFSCYNPSLEVCSVLTLTSLTIAWDYISRNPRSNETSCFIIYFPLRGLLFSLSPLLARPTARLIYNMSDMPGVVRDQKACVEVLHDYQHHYRTTCLLFRQDPR